MVDPPTAIPVLYNPYLRGVAEIRIFGPNERTGPPNAERIWAENFVNEMYEGNLIGRPGIIELRLAGRFRYYRTNVYYFYRDSDGSMVSGEMQVIMNETHYIAVWISLTDGFYRIELHPMLDSVVFPHSLQSGQETEESRPSTITATRPAVFTTYQQIFDYYSARLRQATPGLLDDFRRLAATNTRGLDGLIALNLSKTEVLAAIYVEGLSEMANLTLTSGGDMDDYARWAGRLNNVYLEEGTEVQNLYLQLASQ